MPKLKPSDQEQRDRVVRACFAGNQEREGIDDETLAKSLGVTAQTIRNKKRRPGTFTLDELQAASRILHFSAFQCAAIGLGRELTTAEIKDFIL